MRIFLGIVGLLLLLSLGSQTIRHGYWTVTASNRSALEPFAGPTEQQIAQSKSLDELVQLYGPIHKKAEEERKRLEKEAQEKKPGDDATRDNEYDRRDREPFKSEEQLKSAIDVWELQQREIFEVQFYWWCGAVIALAGLSLLILGFTEMSYATCPAVPFGGSHDEFARLISYKLCCSLAAVAALMVAWWHVSRRVTLRFPARTAVPN